MVKRIAGGLIGAILGYALGAVLGYAAIAQWSSNTHDRSFEAATTALLVAGPLVAAAGLAGGLIVTRKGSGSSSGASPTA